MNLRITHKHIVSALGRVGRIISPRPQLPITGCVLILATESDIFFVSTNLETTCTVSVPGKINKEGSFCVPARLLLECINTFPDEPVNLSQKEGALLITCGDFEATVPGMSADEFPKQPTAQGPKGVTFPKKDLLGAAQSVLFSLATDEGRPLLTGVKITSSSEGSTIVATDGYRLSVKKSSLTTSEPIDMVIPGKTFYEVIKSAEEDKETETISLSASEDGGLLFNLGSTTYFTRRINGEYPKYDKIIPKTYTTKTTVNRGDLFRAIKSAAVFAKDNANIVRMIIAKDTITLSANTPNVGSNKVVLRGEVEGDGGEIAFNARFLIDFFSHVEAEEILFEMTGALNPGVFRIRGDESYLHVIMPVRVQS